MRLISTHIYALNIYKLNLNKRSERIRILSYRFLLFDMIESHVARRSYLSPSDVSNVSSFSFYLTSHLFRLISTKIVIEDLTIRISISYNRLC